MSEEELKKVADFLYDRLIIKQDEAVSEDDTKFIIIYESEDDMIIDKIIDEVTDLHRLKAHYENVEKFELAGRVRDKIAKLEKKIEEKLK